MRFYFHLESGNGRILDFEGAELADLKAAHRHALRFIDSSTSRRKVGGAEQTSPILHLKAPLAFKSTSAGSTSGGLGIHCDGNRSSADLDAAAEGPEVSDVRQRT
jgi:hypothetical protein